VAEPVGDDAVGRDRRERVGDGLAVVRVNVIQEVITDEGRPLDPEHRGHRGTGEQHLAVDRDSRDEPVGTRDWRSGRTA